ncbi:MAG: hypothetical protein JRH20_24325 [Deltaproteobacteria bacterium]|nr:hypothetical protein [Deltaproteobacteria bacterium]
MNFFSRGPALFVLAGALFCLIACEDDLVLTTTKNLHRPSAIAMACIGRSADDAGVQTGFTADRCEKIDTETTTDAGTTDAGTTDAGTTDAGTTDPGVRGTLFGLVANSARGDVALFRTDQSGEPLVDLDPASPGFGFVPVGSLPTDMKTTSDGCRAFTANSGSCDLSSLDVPGMVQLAADELKQPASSLVRRIVPHTSAGPLLARPHELVVIPQSVPDKGDDRCDAQAAYRAFVTFPSCNLVAELDLRTGLVLQAVKIEADGTFTTTNTPNCKPECSASVPIPDATYPMSDGSLSDAAVDARVDGPVLDGPVLDGPVLDGPVGDGPVGDAAVDGPGDDTRDGSTGERVDGGVEVDATADDAKAAIDPMAGATGPLPQSIVINADGTRIFISSAGANFISAMDVGSDGLLQNARAIVLSGEKVQTTRLAITPETRFVGEFIYAVARDQSVRVISTALERECETNLDLSILPSTASISLERARCFPVGDPDTPPQRVTATGSGLRFGARVPVEVTFMRGLEPPDEASDAESEAVPLYGVFALVATSDGTVFVVDVEDWRIVSSEAPEFPRTQLPHRIRNASLGGEEEESPKLEVASVVGGGLGGVPVVVESEEPATDADPLGIRAVAERTNLSWLMTYEPRLVVRLSGQLLVDENKVWLHDRGAEFCDARVLGRLEEQGRALRHGDIVGFVGCDQDEDCAVNQTCERVVGQESEFGLCFDRGRTADLLNECGAFLRGKREFLVRRAERDRLLLDVLPEEPQRVFKEEGQIGECVSNGDCADGYLCALWDRLVPDDAELSLTKGDCFRPGCTENADCASGYCVQPLAGGFKVCASAPPPLEIGQRCDVDESCRSNKVGEICESDGGCDAASECRYLTNTSSDKTCVDRGWRCQSLPSVGRRCMRPSPCFSQLQRYEVRAGRSFMLATPHRVVADPQTGECVDDSEKSPLLQPRIDIGLPVYPVVMGPTCQNKLPGVPEPNPCVAREESGYLGFESKAGAEGDRSFTQGGPTYQIHYANPDFHFRLGMSHLTALPAASEGGVATSAAMPERGLSIEFEVQTGYSWLVAPGASTVALPHRMLVAPDGYLYMVDTGDITTVTGTRVGQVLRWQANTLVLDLFSMK